MRLTPHNARGVLQSLTMRSMAVIVVSVLSSVVLTGTASPRERTRGYQRPGVVAGFDVTTGQERWRNVIGKEEGASVDVWAVGGVMVVQRTRCLSADRDYRSGDTRLVGFDAADRGPVVES